MSKSHHSFSVEHAQTYGIECAILIHHFQFWIEQNQRLGINFYEGRTWMYQSQKEIAAIYPYWNRDKVQELIQKLVDSDVLMKANFNKTEFDRTTWYAFKNEEMFTIVRNRTMECAKPHNGKCGTAQSILKDAKDKDTKKATTDEPIAVAVSFYEILKETPLSDEEKRQLNRYPEEVVKNAHEWITKTEKKPKTSWIQLYAWACENKPEIPKSKEDNIKINRELALKHQKEYGTHDLWALSKGIEICKIGRDGGLLETIKYDISTEEFKAKLLNCIKKYNLE